MKCIEIKVVRNPNIQPTIKYVERNEIECDGAPRILYNLFPTFHGSGLTLKILVYEHQYKQYHADIEHVVQRALNDYITTSDIHELAGKIDDNYDYIEKKKADEFVLIINPVDEDP